MKILAFETSCDDTSIALFEDISLIAMHTKSQIKIHNETGGVVPEVASREHANVIFDVLDEVLHAGIEKKVFQKNTLQDALREIDYIAVTTHPGLVPSLLTGITVASTLSHTLHIPILPINHIEAHIFSNFLERPDPNSSPTPLHERGEIIEFPLVCLTVSGGHNEVWYMRDMWTKEKLGHTQDDAAGEAYDKVAKMMGLGYPGGPIISKLAEEYEQQYVIPANTGISQSDKNIQSEAKRDPATSAGGQSIGAGGQSIGAGGYKKPLFPRVFLEKSEFGFSFSGLKSAVKREIDARTGTAATFPVPLSENDQREISYEFQNAVNEVLAYKIIEAAKQKQAKTILLAGGVSANDDLRGKISEQAEEIGVPFFSPSKKLYCMDNAAMIGILAYYRIKYKKFEHHIGNVEIGMWEKEKLI